ncbi:hypothetical protein CAPTEDRAFT_155979 [Capitella teleta]|uniref:ABC transporter domain-containing protein n=1 Tax=Capitella teleta TaxID=283909 RepID=R7VB48_CAPTE|nr:hypothetical protein CAPTEDRAFT_155979 [Capitella teleta]|eukprot:ELU16058.1 hypothetical protein CAPTEDRAFT_155979 [Capitella teleta]
MSKPAKEEGSVMSFHDINYEVQVKDPKKCRGIKNKHVLTDISGIMKPGMNAIMGPTGSGKSSLLDVLAGRKNPVGLSGTVLVDGKQQPKNFKCMSGYVVQDDVVMGTLTIRENFMFSANLRLPASVSQEEKAKVVQNAIYELGLTHAADSKVGTEFIRGVSGGERKRCNIGMELIISPSFLFLDEPTTGLDASTANAVLLILHRLSRHGRTIIFSIHQPRFSIYRLFDSLTLLSLGRTVYHGPSRQGLDFFSSLGHTCEAHNNPPDFFLDVINGDSTAVQSSEGIMANGGESSCPLVLHPRSPKRVNIDPIYEAYQGSPDEPRVVGEYATGFFTQLKYVCIRTVLNNFRNPATSILQILITIVFSIITGLIFLQIDNDLQSGIQNRTGLFFFIAMNQVFSNLSAVELFIKERVAFVHENASGFYRVSTYFLSKVFCDLVPLRLFPVIIYSIIVYFMIGLQMPIEKLFVFMLTLLALTLTAAAIGFFMSSTVRIFAVANLSIALIYVFSMIFGGLLVNVETLGVWISWVKYLSIFRYGLNALSINELKDMEFCAKANGTVLYCTTEAGNEYLHLQGIPYETAWDFWQNLVGLFAIFIGVMVLTYIQLRRIPKLK